MILKIRRTDVKDGWMFLDGVESVMISKNKDIRAMAVDAQGSDRVNDLDISVVPIFSECGDMLDSGIFISCTSNTNPYEIYCNTEIYLMNDDGETIERFTP